MSAAKDLLRSYGVIVVAVVVFLATTVAVDPLARGERTIAAQTQQIAPGQAPPQRGSIAEQLVAQGTDGTPGQPGSVGSSDNPTGYNGYVPPGAKPCPDRVLQVPGDPYSPPCFVLDGASNGGATYQGVFPDTIKVAVRVTDTSEASAAVAEIGGGRAVQSSPESYERTLYALVDYFNARFQFYGRKIELVPFEGQGTVTTELQSGGKEQALADATRVAQELKAFADISGISNPYADALSQLGVVNFGAPYPARDWFEERSPYAWSIFPDGTIVVESFANWMINRIGPNSNADFAGPALVGRPRKIGAVGPENPEYQGSGDIFRERLGAAGMEIALNLSYRFDIASMPNQASNIIAQLKDAEITSVIASADPIMLALGLTPKANEQDYEPEWFTHGLAFVEQDVVSQLLEPRQWQHAFGMAFNAESEPQGGSFPYAAFKQMRPSEEPAIGVEEFYYQIYMLAIGLQMAGPNLTPEAFRDGMYSYPGGSGPRGYWRFGPGDHTSVNDFREMWWSTETLSPQNNQPGAWIQLNGGARYFADTVPKGPAPYFQG